jgi:hypothetical protein
MKSTYWLAGAALGLAIIVPATAWAGHGKAGLWEIKIENNMTGVPGAGRANGAHVGKHCMTPTEASKDRPDFAQSKSCKLSNMKSSPRSFSADMTCEAPMKGTGHIEIVFLSPDHYTVSQTITASMDGRPVSMVMKADAKWISADCGKVK